VPGVKAMIAHLEGDSAHARTLPPLAPLDAGQIERLLARYNGLRQPAGAEF
jgi:hypothetical protein